MKTFRTLFPMLGVLAVLAGCSGESSSNAGAESASSTQAKATAEAPKAGPHRPHMGHGGPGMLLFAALHEDIGLSAEQKTTIQDLVAQNRPPAPPADKSRVTALASAIRAGKVDAASLQPSRGAIDAAHKEHAATLAKSLATLHDTLTKEQRSALVEKIAAKASAHGPRGEMGEKREKGKEGGRPGGFEHGPGPMHLLEGLDLTEAQKKEIQTKLEASRPQPPSDADREGMRAKLEAAKKEMDAKLQTFKADAFDANAFVTPPAGAPQLAPPGHADRMANELSIIVSVLDQAQREKLAAKIEQGPPARPAR